MALPAIQMIDVTVELGGDIILNNINLEVKMGELLAIIGPSGGGKTVLLKTMAGIYAPTKGRVLCEGEDWQALQSQSKHDLACKVGMQFQKAALFDALTTAENIAFPMQEHKKWNDQQIEKKVRSCLDLVGLGAAHDLYPHELSGGMQLRLGIARAMALDPEIIFYDDPTAGLDPLNTDKMIDLIKQIRQQTGATIIIVTHSVDIAYELADRIVMVANKELIVTGTSDQTIHHPDPRVQQFIHGRIEGPLKEV